MSSTLESPRGGGRDIAKCKPRLGFVGLGWIGRHRLEAIARTGAAEIVVVADSSPKAVADALADRAPTSGARSLEDVLAVGVDGVVIATPSALHAEQAMIALEDGVAVFCQKPLGRTAAEVRSVIDAARRADLLLGVDLSYRFVEGIGRIKQLVDGGDLGKVYAMDLTFHNAYGPDKSWFLDPALSGGGCVIDLGIHLVDLALWMLGWPAVRTVTPRLFAGGRSIAPGTPLVEDYAVAQLDLDEGVVARLACSWWLPAGRDAVIEVVVYGTKAAASLRNVQGSFYDFVSELHHGTSSRTMSEPPDDWGGRAAVDWVATLASGGGFSPGASEFEAVAAVIDAIYGRGS